MGFAAHAVDFDKLFLSDTGYRSFLGGGGDLQPGFTPDSYATAIIAAHEWAHEEEYRLLLHSGFDLRERSTRKLEYRFEDLTGVIFGARTELEDKLRIIRIIDQKCAKIGRSDFEFLEVRYAPEAATFQLFPLGLVRTKYG